PSSVRRIVRHRDNRAVTRSWSCIAPAVLARAEHVAGGPVLGVEQQPATGTESLVPLALDRVPVASVTVRANNDDVFTRTGNHPGLWCCGAHRPCLPIARRDARIRRRRAYLLGFDSGLWVWRGIISSSRSVSARPRRPWARAMR